jgi:hypothetical protein
VELEEEQVAGLQGLEGAPAARVVDAVVDLEKIG